jgi:small-conductance mechanosensitive channel
MNNIELEEDTIVFLQSWQVEGAAFARSVWDIFLQPHTYFQLAAVVIVLAVALALGKAVSTRVSRKQEEGEPVPGTARRLLHRAVGLIAPLFVLVLLLPVQRVSAHFFGTATILETSFRLAMVWLLWSAVRGLVSSPLVRTVGSFILVPVALLYLFQELEAVIAVLESASFDFGKLEITAYTIVKAIVFFSLVFSFARFASQLGPEYIRRNDTLTISTKELVIKLFDIVLYMLMFVVTLDLIGIDLTALTIFSGALGVGLGFGLQKVASNFISGIILLSEKTVTLGNLVEMDNGTIGYLRKLGARASVIETFSGREVMVPNEDFITSRVSNLTHSSTRGRIEIPVGVSYHSDLNKAHDVILEAAKGYEKASTAEGYEPECLLRSFSDSSVDFLLIFWMDNVTEGMWAAQSDMMFRIWNALKDNDIEIPFPQRDLHLRSSDIPLPGRREPEPSSDGAGDGPADDRADQSDDGDQDTSRRDSAHKADQAA